MGNPVRIGLVGVGKIARDQHIPSIAGNSDFTLAAVASRHGRVDGVANFPIYRSDARRPARSRRRRNLHAAAGALRGGEACALARGKHVLMEKPPCTSMLQLDNLVRLAKVAGRTFYQTWHSQHAHGVAPAARLLRERALRRAHVTWKEDVRQWHPGQTWIWQAGGFGVFDPAINAFSILTALFPEPFFPAFRDALRAVELRGADRGGCGIRHRQRRANLGCARFPPHRRADLGHRYRDRSRAAQIVRRRRAN